jgi:hypothetical protein
MTQTIDAEDLEGKGKGRGKLAILTRKWLWLDFLVSFRFLIGLPLLLANPTWIPENPSVSRGSGALGSYDVAFETYNLRKVFEYDYPRNVGILGMNFLLSFQPYLIAWALSESGSQRLEIFFAF